MKLLLVLLLIATTLVAKAQQIDGPAKVEANSTISITCIIMITLITLLIAGAIYFIVRNNKRRRTIDQTNSERNI
jgi:heme/copper-type cytochrome/quinol oxidase subunit 2